MALTLGSDGISVDDSLPSFLSKSVVNRATSHRVPSPPSPNNKIQPKTLKLETLFNDKTLNYTQKERLAEAALKGELYELSNSNISNGRGKKERSRHEIDRKSHSNAHMSRHSYQPRILGVISQSVPLLPPEMKDKQAQIERQKQIGQGTSEFRWGPKIVPTVPLHVPKSTQLSNSNSVPEGYLSRGEVIAESKRCFEATAIQLIFVLFSLGNSSVKVLNK